MEKIKTKTLTTAVEKRENLILINQLFGKEREKCATRLYFFICVTVVYKTRICE